MRNIFYDARVTLTGYTDLIMHKMSVADLKPKARGSQTSKEDPDEWKKSTHIDLQGHVCIPNDMIRGVIYTASKGEKIGKLYMSKLAPVGLLLSEMSYKLMMPIGNNGAYKPITIDDIETNNWVLVAPVVVKSGGRITRYRTCLPAGWQVQFDISVLDPNLSLTIVTDLFEKAGYAAGIGCWRPSSPKPGIYGQFDATVEKIQVERAA